MIALIVPGGFNDTVTYAAADLTDTTKVFEQHGVRLLTAEEIHSEMPQYPL